VAMTAFSSRTLVSHLGLSGRAVRQSIFSNGLTPDIGQAQRPLLRRHEHAAGGHEAWPNGRREEEEKHAQTEENGICEE
jgi:hypothetical protein